MSVKYVPVQWNRNKWIYDAVLLIFVGLYVWVFLNLGPVALDHARPVDTAIATARAFGSCAFFMLTIILAIGPLARLDRRFLPLLYNRRHFGVLTCFVALTHAYAVLNWYFSFGPTPKWEAVLNANTSYGQFLGFPFEALGIFALICLMILAATSHDFWLKFLSPPVWKGIHFLIYPAYAAVVGHVALGALQSQENLTFGILFALCGLAVAGLHVAAARHETRLAQRAQTATWCPVGTTDSFVEGRARIVVLPDGDRVAVFLHQGKLSAIANACAHQNGPLGEGRIVDCLVTCPWHGFQYEVTNGRSPAPFTEQVPTYNLKLDGDIVFVDPAPNPPGTFVEPLALSRTAAETPA